LELINQSTLSGKTMNINSNCVCQAGLPDMKMGNWPKYPQKLAKIGHFKTLKWPPIGQKNTAFFAFNLSNS
jgi:hypothetical protein